MCLPRVHCLVGGQSTVTESAVVSVGGVGGDVVSTGSGLDQTTSSLVCTLGSRTNRSSVERDSQLSTDNTQTFLRAYGD